MLISVVTAVFNREATVGDTMRSVQSQSYPYVEHVVQDGGSNDGSVQEIRRLANDFTRLVSEPDGGIYDAINRGIERATGDIVGLMHSDDVYASCEVLSKVAREFADPAIDGVYGDLQYVAADDLGKVVRYWRSGKFRPELLRRGWMPPHPTLYLRREVLSRLGLYDTSYKIAADYDAMLRYLGHGSIDLAYIPEVLVKMRLGGESNGSLRRIMSKSREDLRALRRNRIGGLGVLLAKNARKLGQFF